MSLHYRIYASKFFIVLYQILSWEGAAGGATSLLGQLYHSEVMGRSLKIGVQALHWW